MALGPTWRNGWYVYLLWGRWRCLCMFWVLLISRSNTVPVRGNWCLCRFVLLYDWGIRSVIGVRGVTYWRTRVFVRKYPHSNYCNIRLGVVYEFIASLCPSDYCVAFYACSKGFNFAALLSHTMPPNLLHDKMIIPVMLRSPRRCVIVIATWGVVLLWSNDFKSTCSSLMSALCDAYSGRWILTCQINSWSTWISFFYECRRVFKM